jgi:hypothetical protein
VLIVQGDAAVTLNSKSKIQIPNGVPLVFTCPPPLAGGSAALQRPSESLKVLIAQAMAERSDRSMMVGEIYQRIKDKHAFYRSQAEASWQSSIRHCLTINKCFVKVPKAAADAAHKGGCWTMVPEADPALQQLLEGRGAWAPSPTPMAPVVPTQPFFAAALAQAAAIAAAAGNGSLNEQALHRLLGLGDSSLMLSMLNSGQMSLNPDAMAMAAAALREKGLVSVLSPAFCSHLRRCLCCGLCCALCARPGKPCSA